MDNPSKKKVIVFDSYDSGKIARILQELYGENAEVFSLEDTDEKNLPATFDLLFISGIIKLTKQGLVETLKERHGSPHAKIIAISVSLSYLDEVKSQVDFVHNKCELIDNQSADDLSPEEKEKLRGYLFT